MAEANAPVSGEGGPKNGGVFIVHSTVDAAKAKVVSDGLRDKGMEIISPDIETSIGKPVMDILVDAVNRSQVVLVLVSAAALKSEWVNFEILLAFEKSHREGAMCVRLVFEGVPEEDRKDFKKGPLELIPEILLDFNKDTWKDDLVEKIREKALLKDLLPAGNVALGLVYNYFIGFLRIVLPAVTGAIANYALPAGARMSKRFLILIPNTCKVPRLETTGEFTIRKLDQPLVMEAAHGDKRRSYNTTVYGIKRADGEEYLFTGECPFILETMSKMKGMNFADLNLDYQVKRFHLTLMDIVNHRGNDKCNGTASIIFYNDKDTTPAAAIWHTLQEEMTELETRTEGDTVLHKVGKTPQAPEYDAFITYCDHEEDQALALDIAACLGEKGLIVTDSTSQWSGEEPERWKIFILSRNSIRNHRFVHQFKLATERSMASDKVQLVPVLSKTMDVMEVPLDLRWTHLLKQSELNYLEMLWAAMQGDKKMVVQLSTGNVWEGLAYSYVINYLAISLLGKTAKGREFKERFLDAMVKYNVTDCKCVAKVFLIVPKTCSFPEPGTQFKGEVHLGPLEPVEIGVRKYFLQFYQLTLDSGEKVCYAREYATPAITMYEMADKYAFAGLNVEEKYRQAKQFADFVTEVITDKRCKQKVGDIEDRCSVVYFDDEETGLSGMTQAVGAQLSACLKRGEYLEHT